MFPHGNVSFLHHPLSHSSVLTAPLSMALSEANPHIATLCVILLACLYFYRKLHPTPLPGIPYNKDAPNRIFGDLALIKAQRRETLDFSSVIFSLTRNLGTPIAQALFTSFSTPYILVDDPREVEDILVRRSREFDRPSLTSSFRPLLPQSTIAQSTTPELKAQKRLWSDVMSADFLKRVVAPNVLASAQELIELWRIKAGREGSKSFSPAQDLECAVLDAIWVALLGSKLGALRGEIDKATKSSSESDCGGSAGDNAVSSSAITVQKAMAYMNQFVFEG